MFILISTINIVSKVLPKKLVIVFFVFLFALVPLNIAKDYFFVLRNCTLIGYIKSNHNILSWDKNFLFMENKQLGSFNSLDRAFEACEKDRLSGVILTKDNKYFVFKTYEIGFLKRYLSKELNKDENVLVNKNKIKELGFNNYYISFQEGRHYEREVDFEARLSQTTDITLIKKYYSESIKAEENGDYNYSASIMESLAYNPLTPSEILLDIKHNYDKSTQMRHALISNPGSPYEILFDYMEEFGSPGKIFLYHSIDRYMVKLKREKRFEEYKEANKLSDRDFMEFRKVHEKYQKIYDREKIKNNPSK